MNHVVMALQRLGFVIGSMYVLSVPGRQSGIPRSTPVSLLTVDGVRYIVAGLDDADWVHNARAVGRGILHRGRVDEHVTLTELPVAERAPILHEFPRLVPSGVRFFTRLYGVTADPEAFAKLAPHCPVFRVDRR
jgi:deazaflavin-dependent oxidoreductase (nitroreductase family)